MTDMKTQVKNSLSLKFSIRDMGTLIGLVIIFAVFAVLSPVFLTVPNAAVGH